MTHQCYRKEGSDGFHEALFQHHHQGSSIEPGTSSLGGNQHSRLQAASVQLNPANPGADLCLSPVS